MVACSSAARAVVGSVRGDQTLWRDVVLLAPLLAAQDDVMDDLGSNDLLEVQRGVGGLEPITLDVDVGSPRTNAEVVQDGLEAMFGQLAHFALSAFPKALSGDLIAVQVLELALGAVDEFLSDLRNVDHLANLLV